jgi:hypothetical protein
MPKKTTTKVAVGNQVKGRRLEDPSFEAIELVVIECLGDIADD